MSDLNATLSSVLVDRFAANAVRVRELAAPLSDAQFWKKPFPYGNSFGHLVIHLTGNLNYYIGAQIAKTGFVHANSTTRILGRKTTLFSASTMRSLW